MSNSFVGEALPMQCPNCQTDNTKTAKFCSECGVSLVEASTTPSSSEENPILRIGGVVYPANIANAG